MSRLSILEKAILKIERLTWAEMSDAQALIKIRRLACACNTSKAVREHELDQDLLETAHANEADDLGGGGQ